MDIDIVVAWVDGSDPLWLAEIAKYPAPGTKDGDCPNRYRDWGLLPWWFRAVERFAPWVRRIHFVTWGHMPAFLNRNAPKLHIVNHEDFIPKEYLPTFSSHTIELNLHRIPGLAEHFIYFNDDSFLLRPMEAEDFFRNGLPCTWGQEVPWVFRGEVGVWAHAAANDLGVINAHFSKKEAMGLHGSKFLDSCYGWKNNLRSFALYFLYPDYFTGFRNLHAPAAYRKSTFAEVWAAEEELLDGTCRNRCRTAEDVNQWLMLWWQVASGQFSPRRVECALWKASRERLPELSAILRGKRHDFVYLHDPEVWTEELCAELKEIFDQWLPEKSGFEI